MNNPFAPSRAEAFFREINAAADQFGFVEGLIGGELGEGEFVDYKSGMEDGGPLSKETVNGIWSKALSGFGNADGGVIVWGINARDNLPTSLALVPDAQKLEGRLKKSLPNATEPPLQGVEILSITKPNSSGQGFVVCFIPPSPWRPHKAKWPEAESDYFIRIGDNCVPAPHSTLRALFYPSHVPWIEIHLESTNNHALHAILRNTGLGTAREVFIIAESAGLDLLEAGDRDFVSQAQGIYPGIPISARRPIHPSEKVRFATFSSFGPEDILVLKFRVFLQDQPASYHRVKVDTTRREAVFHATASLLPPNLAKP